MGLFISVSALSFAQSADSAPADSMMIKIGDEVDAYLEPLASISVKVRVLSMDMEGDSAKIHFNNLMGDYPFRDSTVAGVYAIAEKYLPGKDIAIYRRISCCCICPCKEPVYAIYRIAIRIAHETIVPLCIYYIYGVSPPRPCINIRGQTPDCIQPM